MEVLLMAEITVDALLSLALSEDGYLEKASPAQEDDKTANAGSNNFTKYGRDLQQNVGSPYSDGVKWCDEFHDWLYWKLGGKQAILDNLFGLSAYTPTSAQFFKDHGLWYTGKSPKPCYEIFFKNSSRICHTGIVTKCENGMVYTVEGNTSSEKGVVANGGCVRQKSYSVNYANIAGYGIPAFLAGVVQPSNQAQATLANKTKSAEIKKVQKFINKVYMPNMIKVGVFTQPLVVDGIYGKQTRHAILALWKTVVGGLDPMNSNFGPKCVQLASLPQNQLHKGSKGDLALFCQMLYKCKGFYLEGDLDADFGLQCCQATVDFEKANNLIVEPVNSAVVGQQVWYRLFN
jgi:hypothetical protein